MRRREKRETKSPAHQGGFAFTGLKPYICKRCVCTHISRYALAVGLSKGYSVCNGSDRLELLFFLIGSGWKLLFIFCRLF